MHALNKVYPHGIHLPEYFFGKNIVHLPTVKTHIYTTTTGAMKNALAACSTHAVITRILGYMKHWSISSPFKKKFTPGYSPLWTERCAGTARDRGR